MGCAKVDVVSVFTNPPRPHSRDRQITAEEDAPGPDGPDEPLEYGRVRVGRDVEQHVPRLSQHGERIADVLRAIRPADVRDDDPGVWISPLDLQHVREIGGIAQASGTRDMEHDNPAMPVQDLQLMVR